MFRRLRYLFRRRRWDEPKWLDQWDEHRKAVYNTTYRLMEKK